MTSSSPTLEGEALKAVKYRGGPLQIIASAGSGKTEVVAQRVTDLFCQGEAPDSVVAFTFTERAADSLKTRIEQRVEERLGKAFVDRLRAATQQSTGQIYSNVRRPPPEAPSKEMTPASGERWGRGDGRGSPSIWDTVHYTLAVTDAITAISTLDDAA